MASRLPASCAPCPPRPWMMIWSMRSPQHPRPGGPGFEIDQERRLPSGKEDFRPGYRELHLLRHRGEKLVVENALAQAVYDTYPVSPGHVLVIPRRHAVTIWDLDEAEYAACFALVRKSKEILELRHRPDGFNVGVNCGVFAGQSVMHAHIHLIP